MAYFFSHFFVILIAGLFVALFAGIWAYVSYRRDQERDGDEPVVNCSMGCSGCGMSSTCGRSKTE